LRAVEIPLPAAIRRATAVLFVTLGLPAAARSWFGWMRTERALREQHPLAGPGVGSSSLPVLRSPRSC
jgi:putative membrane protein